MKCKKCGGNIGRETIEVLAFATHNISGNKGNPEKVISKNPISHMVFVDCVKCFKTLSLTETMAATGETSTL